jgi:uncharacterized protein YodC (DUF2158 family)
MENKFKSGEVVMERIRPSLKLTVSRYANGIYYCLIQERDSKRELVYSERELVSGISFNGTTVSIPLGSNSIELKRVTQLRN